MNELDYASREAAQRLQDAGIVLETEAGWSYEPCDGEDGCGTVWKWILRTKQYGFCTRNIPAPSMAEVWRELPQNKGQEDTYILQLHLGKNSITYAGYYSCAGYDLIKFSNTNPTDALIYLLIWVRKEKP